MRSDSYYGFPERYLISQHGFCPGIAAGWCATCNEIPRPVPRSWEHFQDCGIWRAVVDVRCGSFQFGSFMTQCYMEGSHLGDSARDIVVRVKLVAEVQL